MKNIGKAIGICILDIFLYKITLYSVFHLFQINIKYCTVLENSVHWTFQNEIRKEKTFNINLHISVLLFAGM